jgi:hypothetical protein
MSTPRIGQYRRCYGENSYIVSNIPGALTNLISRLHGKIASENPGMRFSIREYYTGGGGNVTGAMTEVDFLGSLGDNDVFASSLYTLSVSGSSIFVSLPEYSVTTVDIH